MKQYCMELVGAFFLAMAVVFNGNPLAIGLMFMAMYYVGEGVSGGYYNPIFAIAAWLRGVLKIEDMCAYSALHVAGAFLAVFWYHALTSQVYMTDATADTALTQAVLLELILSAALALVFLTVATSKDYKGSVVNGLVIGLSITGLLYLTGLYNPAIAAGSLLHQLFSGGAGAIPNDVLMQYILGPVAGAVVAAYAYDFLNSK